MHKLVLVIGAIVALAFSGLYTTSTQQLPNTGGTQQQQGTTSPDESHLDGTAPYPYFP